MAVTHTVRRGRRYWTQSLGAMLRWDALGLRRFLPLMLVIQTLIGAGMVIMYGFYFADLSPRAALYIATGAPTLALIPIGFVLVPAMVASQRMADTYDFIWSLPVPRLVSAMSSFTLFTLVAIPGMAVALVVASWRYGIDVDISPAIVLAIGLTALMSTSVGFGMAHAIANPLVVNLITNMLIFFVLLFSPVVYPAEQVPGWLMAIHQVLPFHHMAVVIRAGLSEGLVTTSVGVSYAVLVAWTVAGWGVTAWVVGRRG